MDYLETEAAKTASPSAKHSSHKTGQDRPRGTHDRRGLLPCRRGRSLCDRAVGDCAPPPSRARGARWFSSRRDCEIPASWSQLATNVVANKYFYGEVNTDEREKSVRQLIHRVSRTIADWGLEDGYFATPDDARAFLPRSVLALPAPALRRSIRRCGSTWGSVSSIRRQGRDVQLALGRRVARRPSSPRTPTNIRRRRPASSRACRTTWKTSWSSPAARPCSSSSARARARTCPRCARIARSFPAAASRRARCRSCGSTTRLPPWSRAAARPAGPPRCSRSRSGIPTSWSSSSARTTKRRRPGC